MIVLFTFYLYLFLAFQQVNSKSNEFVCEIAFKEANNYSHCLEFELNKACKNANFFVLLSDQKFHSITFLLTGSLLLQFNLLIYTAFFLHQASEMTE